MPYADVKLVVDANNRAWIAYEDLRGENNGQVILTRVDSQNTPTASLSWSGQAPDIAASENSVVLIWNDHQGAVKTIQQNNIK